MKMLQLLVLLSSLAYGATAPLDSTGSPRADSIKLHEETASAHLKAAECLKLGKPMDQCQREMFDQCAKTHIMGCLTLSASDLRRHSKTHQLGGQSGK